MITIEAHEVDGFTTAVPGVKVEYVRTDAGRGPCRMIVSGSDWAQLSIGSMGFSAIAGAEIPSDVTVFALITSAPPGGSFCGVELDVGQLFRYAPGTTFAGVEPKGVGATMLTVPTAAVERLADRRGEAMFDRSVEPLESHPHVDCLKDLLWAATRHPSLGDDAGWNDRILDAALGVVTAHSDRRDADRNRLDSKKIVADAIDFVESMQAFHPTMNDLCRGASASESRVRQAFVEIFDVPPSRYFRHRLLSRLRSELLMGDPVDDSVTRIASSLGVTQLGRVAGRYRAVFDESPRDTLLRQ